MPNSFDYFFAAILGFGLALLGRLLRRNSSRVARAVHLGVGPPGWAGKWFGLVGTIWAVFFSIGAAAFLIIGTWYC
jgi:hypothetical protein